MTNSMKKCALLQITESDLELIENIQIVPVSVKFVSKSLKIWKYMDVRDSDYMHLAKKLDFDLSLML